MDSNDDVKGSPSSTQAEGAGSDSQEQLLEAENKSDSNIVTSKERRLNRRIALALARQGNILNSKINSSFSQNKNNTIDLSLDSDDPTNEWFKKTFKATKKPERKSLSPMGFAVPKDLPKNVPRSLKINAVMKKKLEQSMSIKRRQALQLRKQMYDMDNEHLRPVESDEEEDEFELKTRRVKKPLHDDSDEEQANEADDESKQPLNFGDSMRADDEMSVNLLDDSFTYDVFNNVKHHQGPSSTIFEPEPREDIVMMPAIDDDMGLSQDSADILSFCSGKFGVEEELFSARRRKPVLESDEEDQEDESSKIGENTESKSLEDKENVGNDGQENVLLNEAEEVKKPTTSRIILGEDEESEEEEEAEQVEDEEECLADGEDLHDEEEEEEPEPEEPTTMPNFDDEDDELAVIKRLEYEEFQHKSKKKNFFDDEASLSGDDVGSDIDENELGNEYEAEEGDNDDVPDIDTIRKQNHRLLLKQESDKERRALAKLQDRLLADGDLGGVETNRGFRFKIREEQENRVEEQQVESVEDVEEEEVDEEKKAERVEMLQFRIENAQELMGIDDGLEDAFLKAGKIVKKKKTMEAVKVEKPSLLSKSSLATSIQENLSNTTQAKQMYVQKNKAEEMKPSLKRDRKSPNKGSSKRFKSQLSAIE